MDASIIHAPASTRNRQQERDPEMHQTRKGNQWFFDMKAHVGVDKNSGWIHSVTTTDANVHDVTMAAEWLHGEEKVVYGDAGYQGLHKREEMAGQDVGVVCQHTAFMALLSTMKAIAKRNKAFWPRKRSINYYIIHLFPAYYWLELGFSSVSQCLDSPECCNFCCCHIPCHHAARWLVGNSLEHFSVSKITTLTCT